MSDLRERLAAQFSSMEEFHNCTAGKQFTDKCPIDPMMTGIINLLNMDGLSTVSCCEGHKPFREAYVCFASFITSGMVKEFMDLYHIDSDSYVLTVKTSTVSIRSTDVESFDYVRMTINPRDKYNVLEVFNSAIIN